MGNNYWYNGAADEVSIWNRVLNSDEIKMLYRRGANRLKFQVRSCSTSNCSDDSIGASWKGADSTNQTYYSELNNETGSVVNSTSPVIAFLSFTAPQPANNRYFQYRAVLESDDLNSSPDLQYVSVDPIHYENSSSNVITKVGIDYYSLSSILPIMGANNCSAGIKYNLGRGSTYSTAVWSYWNGASWQTSGGTESTANLASEMDGVALAAFPKEGKVYLKAFLRSDGTSPCELSNFQLTGTY